MGQRPSPCFSGLGWAGSGPAQLNPEIFGSSPAHADPYDKGMGGEREDNKGGEIMFF